ncbi:MAG: beta-galactosidase [Eubacterium sp.]|nr:beta-galactosidase [Eubacterium sp.]
MQERKAELGWIDDPRVFRVNQMAAHSDHHFYKTEEEFRAGKSSFRQDLDGTWKFAYAKKASDRPVDFYREDFDDRGFDDIQVPGHIEFAGYERIQYVNIQYPWEGHEYIRPEGAECAGDEHPFSQSDYCPSGSYRLTFDLEPEMRGKRVSIFFEGVEQAVYVWLNGVFIGYGEDSFTPTEFDLTEAIRDQGNVLAVRVYKKTVAAYLEDQDFFRFFGIFRSVYLLARPQSHLEDFWLRAQFDPETSQGKVDLDLTFTGENKGLIGVTILDGQGNMLLQTDGLIRDKMTFSLPMPERVRPWSHQDPYLYQAVFALTDSMGQLVELVPYDFGFRRIEIQEGVMKLNGERLIFCGVNRHEWSAESGRCIGEKERQWDMACFKRNHINAVRTCHYPDQLAWYDMCDREGIYMIGETNLETHGSWGKFACLDPSWNVPGSLPEWEAMTLDRAKTHFEVLKNHTAILIWSLGNESYVGETLVKMNRYYKDRDPDRLVHYEGVFWAPEYKDRISDLESRMYEYPAGIEKYLKEDGSKPFILCEYMHDMGNSMGGLNTYMKLLDKYPSYQGGFIWDFIDQSIYREDPVTGQQVLAYGGDFDDRPADYEFSGDGLVFGNRQEKPAMQEVRYYYGKYGK